MQKTVCVLLLSLCCQGVFGQAPYLRRIQFPQKNQAIQVNAMMQTHGGYLWLGTDHGLFKFDGTHFTSFTLTDGLQENQVTALAEDSVGRIWVGHRNGKISIFENNSAKPFQTEEGLSSKPISKILFDKRGVLWFSTLNDGLYYYRNNRIYRLDDIDGMPDIFVYDIAEDSGGNIWAGTDGGIAICATGAKEIKINTIGSAQGLPDNIIKKIALTPTHAWLVTEDAGVISYNLQTKKTEDPFKNWTFGKAVDVAVAGDQIWVATDQGLFSIAGNGQQSDMVKIDNITLLFQDSEKNVWLGLKSGIIRTLGNKIEFIQTGDDTHADVVAVVADNLGNIWFSTKEGLFKRTGAGIIQKQLVGSSYEKSSVISLYFDPHGYVLAGLYDDGVLKINSSTGQVTPIKEGLRNGSVLNITGFENGVWLATLGGATKLTFDLDKIHAENFSSENGLSTDYIYQVFIDNKKRVWFATDRAGIDMLDQNGFHHFDGEISQKVIYGFAEDGKQQLWANVQGAGLFLFNGTNFKPFSKQNTFRETNINGIIANTQGEIVAIHDNGIDIYNPSKETISFYGEEAGITDQSPNLNAISKDALGRILIGTTNGVVIMSGEAYNSRGPLPVIEGLDVFNQPQALSKSVDLKHDQNNLTIHFTGLWYQNPEDLNFQFKLENHSDSWIETRDHAVSFSQLPPGDYIFQLKASESSDFEKANEVKLEFSISPPFWRTYTFFVVVLLLLGFSGYSFVKYREQQLKTDKLELEKLVYERTMEIERNNEEIKAQAEEINGINENLEGLVKERTQELERKNKALEEYAFINAHQLRAPVASILGLIHLMKDIPLKDHEKDCMNHLQLSAKKLDDVVNSITQAIERGDYDSGIGPDPSEFSE